MAPRRTKTKVPESIKLGKDNAAQSSTSLVKSGMPLGRPARNITSATVPTDALPRPSKRKNDEDVRPSDTKVAKRKTALSTESLARNQPGASKRRAINQAPTQRLHAYVCGDVSAGELGLGPRIKKAKRPYINPHLSGAVQVAVGGMHALALTHDNQILSWGVNDMGALGRDTTWDGGLVDIDDQSVKSDDEMNPLESTPAAIPKACFPENTVITQVAAADSCSFALTEDGSVYGWGTFRDNEGCVGFAFDKQRQLIKVQRTPTRLPMLTGITQIACGSNHALALDKLGRVYAWGNGQQNQLGRRILERTRMQALVPCKVSIPRTKIVSVGCGSYHSFAIDQNGDVWGWGINSHGELGIPTQEDNEASRSIAPPQRVESLRGKRLESVQGGSNHSVGVTSNGECFVWGRADGGQCGLDVKSLPDDSVVRDMRGNVRMVSVPTVIPGIKAATAAAGSDHSFAITTDGKAYSWGFNATYQTGHGPDNDPRDFEDDDDDDPDDVEIATLLDNSALRNANVNWAGAGGQYSIITALIEAKV